MTAGSLQLSSFHFIVWEINTKLAAETPQIRHNVKQVNFSLFTVYILASAKTQSLHQAQNIHLSCAVGSVIWFW